MDIKAYKRNIDDARKQAKVGRVISQEQIEKASENWWQKTVKSSMD